MSTFGDYVIPFTVLFFVMYGLYKGVPVFDCFITGAKEGLNSAVQIIPPIVLLVTLVAMVNVSGAMDALTHVLAPLAKLLGLSPELLPLAFLRPISGSSALVVFENILSTHGADSLIGRTASVMMGSTETTFYTIAIYFAASKVKNTRHAVPSALVGDLVGFVVSAMIVKIIFY